MNTSQTLKASETNLAEHNRGNPPWDQPVNRLPVPAFNTPRIRPMDPVAQASSDQNNAVIRRHVPSFQHITGRASNAKLYSYDATAAELGASPWKECEVSGPLFVIQLAGTERDETPRSAIFIINRKSLESFVLEIHPEGEIGKDAGFIFLRNQRFPEDCIKTPRQRMFLYSSNKPETGADTWGLWIFDEGTARDDPDNCFRIISECDKILKVHYDLRKQTSINNFVGNKVQQWRYDLEKELGFPHEDNQQRESPGLPTEDVRCRASPMSIEDKMIPPQGPLADDQDDPAPSDAASTALPHLLRRHSQ